MALKHNHLVVGISQLTPYIGTRCSGELCLTIPATTFTLKAQENGQFPKYNKFFVTQTLVLFFLACHTHTRIPHALIFARFMQPICSAKLFLAFKAKVIAFFFFPPWALCIFMIIFPFLAKYPLFLQNQSLLIRIAKLHEVARRPPMGGASLLSSKLPCRRQKDKSKCQASENWMSLMEQVELGTSRAGGELSTSVHHGLTTLIPNAEEELERIQQQDILQVRHSGVSRVSTDENEGVAHICRNLRRPTEVLRKKRDFFSFFPWEIQPPVLCLQ